MLNNFSLISLLALFLFACKTENKCSDELINNKEEQLELAFEGWKSALNFMDGEVIFPAQSLLDSFYNDLLNCIALEDSFMIYIDSVSHIYSDLNIEKFEIEKGEKLLSSISKNILNQDNL